MPIHLDSLFSASSPGEGQLMTKLLSNPLSTAAVIAIIFVLTVVLFFPLKTGSCSQYFKLLVYIGVLCAFILSVHEDVLVKNREMRFKRPEIFADGAEVAVPIEPRKGGTVLPRPEAAASVDEEIEEIIRSLEAPAK